MKKTTRRLTLSRETLLRLDERKIQTAAAGGSDQITPMSPWCGPTFWETCTCENG